MEAKEALDIRLIKTDLSLSTKDEILLELASLLKEENRISDIKGFISDVYLRESEGQTGIGNYVAIPHGKSNFVDKPSVAIGINNSEIPWETLDGKGVRVVILFAVGSNSESAKEHLKLLSIFARRLGNDDVLNQLLNANSVKDVVDAFL